MSGSQTQRPPQDPDGAAESSPPPQAIIVYAQTFDLEADPAALEATAVAVRAMGDDATSASATVDTAAQQIESEESWAGETADAFQEHRRKLTADLGEVGSHAHDAVSTLECIAGILRFGQARLDGEKERLAGIPVTAGEASAHPPGGATLRYEPRDETEASLISDAIGNAGEIRNEVDEALAVQEAALRRILTGSSYPDPRVGNDPGLTTIGDSWAPRQTRFLTYNLGMGHGNEPWWMPGGDPAEAGADPGEMDEVGQVIAGSDANVVAVQEVFKGDAGKLVDWLNENTDGHWEYRFTPAELKPQFDDAIIFPDHDLEWFGNATLVRTDGPAAAPITADSIVLEEADGPTGDEGRVVQHTVIPYDE